MSTSRSKYRKRLYDLGVSIDRTKKLLDQDKFIEDALLKELLRRYEVEYSFIKNLLADQKLKEKLESLYYKVL